MRHLRLLAALLFAGVSTAAAAAPALWEVSDADSRIWLFGSVHLLPKDVAWRTYALDQIVSKATKVYFEADVGPLGQMSIVLKLLLGGFKPAQPWIEQLTPEQLAEVEHAASALHVPMDQLKAFDPWLAESVLEEKTLEAMGYLPTLGVDSTLQDELPKEKKAYFETVNGQFTLFAKQPLDDQVGRLLTSVEHMNELPASLNTMLSSWSSGDIGTLAKTIPDDPTLDEGFAKTIIADRNAAWLPVIEKLLVANEEDLIVVGSGHLVGNGSVVELLGKAGFSVKRIQ